jgi:inorganic triphosphatase YgiF
MDNASRSSGPAKDGPPASSRADADKPSLDAAAESAGSVEVELKFTLDPARARKLLKSSTVKRAARGKAARSRLVSTSFDTRQHTLRKAGAALRVRRGGRQVQQTLKLPADGPVGMQNNEEWNVALDGEQPDLRLFPRPVQRRLQRSQHPLRLKPVFTTEIERTTRILHRRGTRIELALDRGRIVGHASTPREQPVCELELELLKGDPLVMLDLALELAEELPLQPLFQSKAMRGYMLARPSLRPARFKARDVPLDAGMSVGQAFGDIAGEALRHLQANQQLVLDGLPGGIHQARVAMRRMRAALRAFKSILPYDKRKAFNGELRWFQSRLAPARDWHVFVTETLPRTARDADPELIKELRKLAMRERRRATAEVSALLRGRRFARLLLQFQRWLLALESDHGELFEQPLRPFAVKVLDKTRRDFLLDCRPLSRMSEEDRHTLRKSGKKARYATEFFSGLWDGPDKKHYLKLMETLQDRLGDANDAVVARLVMASLSPRNLDHAGLLLVQDWSRQREVQAVRKGQPLWRQMQRAKPFWH